jgi:hypothetical protein
MSIHPIITESEADTENQLYKIKEDIRALKLAIKDDIHFLDVKIERSKGEIYKTMFFWTNVVQVIAILGAVLAMVEFMR